MPASLTELVRYTSVLFADVRSNNLVPPAELLAKAWLIGLFLGFTPPAHADNPAPDFAQEVRPILSDRCFGCHGPADQESDLRLDTYEGATDWAILPGDSESSEVIARVLLPDDDDLRMPPIHSDKDRLTPEEVDLLRRWIDAGAVYEEHWAFAPLTRPQTPSAAAALTEIDSFVLRRLRAEGLDFRPEADRTTLARRVAFDLTGLPPTPEMLNEYLADESESAYESFVDRLLASPRYGEHMARYWLDAVRYADTHGKHFDNYREVWPYRDWVVRALNDNKPYDEFLVEQLAGDLLPNPSTDQLVATGFNRCNLTTHEGGVIDKEVYTDNVRDRTDAYGTVVLGLTVACAKCHDHKYDPITQSEYYSLFAFFNSLDGGPKDENRKDHGPVIRVPSVAQVTLTAELEGRLADLRAKLFAPDPGLEAAQRRWEQAIAPLADPEVRATVVGSRAVLASEWLQSANFPMLGGYQVRTAKTAPEKQPFRRDRRWRQRDLTESGWEPRGDLIDGEGHRLALGRMSVTVLRRTLTVNAPTEVEVAFGSDDTVRAYLNREVVHESSDARPLTPGSDRVKLRLKAGENELLVRIGNLEGHAGFSFEVIDAPVVDASLIDLLRTHAAERSPEQSAALKRAFRSRYAAPELARLRKEIAAVEADLAAIKSTAPTTLVFRERPQPRDAFVLNRGDYDNEGAPVERATPAFLPPMDDDLPRDRLGLARWSVAPENPLPARVAVNRLWQQLFGVGLVKTADDFGSQAEPPSHPDLLDWLAADFVENDWDVKRMMKQLAMTQAYRQSSAAPKDLWRQDPENRLIARGARFRLDAEQLRDQALAISGLLVNRIGGPPVRPPQPLGLWKAVAYEASNTAEFVADAEPEKVHRRSLYTFHKRTSPPPQMSVLDGPTREACTVRRERTNTPLQALMLMNDPQYVEAARALAERVLQEAPESADAQAGLMIELATGRPAAGVEVAELVAAVADERERFDSSLEAAERLVAVGVKPVFEGVDRAELAAWTMAANLVLNLDEVVSKN